VDLSSANRRLIKSIFIFSLSLLLATTIFWQTLGGRLALLMRPSYAITTNGGCVAMSKGWYLTENVQPSYDRNFVMVSFIKLDTMLSTAHKNYVQFTFKDEILPKSTLDQFDKYVYPWGNAYVVTDEAIKRHIGRDISLLKNAIFLERGSISVAFLNDSGLNDIQYISVGATSRCAALGEGAS
nr:hypothetical protein [Burkholderiaceae bacterium]